jgi:hypothetical protein
LFFFYFSIIIMVLQFGDMFMYDVRFYVYELIMTVMNMVITGKKPLFPKLNRPQDYLKLLQQSSSRNRRI